jgi:hypothetical protein
LAQKQKIFLTAKKIANGAFDNFFTVLNNSEKKQCLDDCATPQLDTVTLRPAPSDTATIRPTNVFILRQSDPTGVGQSDHTQTAQFDPLEVGLNVGCDNPTRSLLHPAG